MLAESLKIRQPVAVYSKKCFSPLAGIMLAESPERRDKTRWYKAWECFSPLAGIMLAESELYMLPIHLRAGFSPLAGIMLAESPPSETKSSW